MATRLWWSNDLIQYSPFYGRFLYVEIENRRGNLGAFNTVARLAHITDPTGHKCPSQDRSHLKSAIQGEFAQVIWPRSYGAFDLLVVDLNRRGQIYLNSALDVSFPDPIACDPGIYRLHYEVFAEQFPILEFSVELHVTGKIDTTEAKLITSEEQMGGA